MGVHYNKADFITYGKPSLFLDFANKKSLTDRISGNNLITFTRSSTATYVGADGLIKTASANEPRFDHDPVTGESLGLLIEEGRANLLTYSENFSNWTTTDLVVTPSNETSPDGTLTAYKITDTNTTSEFTLNASYSNVDSQYITVSLYVKKENYNRLQIVVHEGGTYTARAATAIFDLDANNVNYTVSFGVPAPVPPTYASIVSVNNGWKKITASFNINSRLNRIKIALNSSTFLTSFGSISTRTGDGTNSAHIWGAQVEVGSFPTSYIPTSGSQVTRTADSAGITGTNFSSWFNTSQGTFFANYISTSPVNARILNFGTGATATIISNEGVMGSGLYFSSIGSISGSASNGVKVSATTSVSESAGSFDGNATVSTGACSYYAGATSLYFIPGTAPIKQNWIKQVRYYPTRLTNAQLQSITK